MAPTFVQVHTATAAAASGVTAANVDIGSGVNRTLVVVLNILITNAAIQSGSSVVFNTSESLTLRKSQVNSWGSGLYHEIIEVWTLDNPSNTTANVVATLSGTVTAVAINAIEFSSANNGIGANTGGYNGNSTDITCTFTTGAATSLIVGGATARNGSKSFAPGADVTERVDSEVGVMDFWVAEKAATGGSDTFNATLDAACRFSIAAIELRIEAVSVKDLVIPNPIRKIQHMLVR